MQKYYVYILQSKKDNKYYIGYTENLDERLNHHNSGMQKSTRNRIPFDLIYFEEFDAKKAAMAREKQIKSYKGGNAFKKLLNL